MHPRKSLLRVFLRAAVSATLACCGHVPVTSMVKLARVDFETSDPAQLRAAIKLPRSLRARPNGVALRITVRVERTPEQARDFVLRELSAPPELAREADAHSHVFAYRIDEADLPGFTAFRAELIAKKSSGQHGSVSISIQPQACKTGELPEGPIYLTTYLRTAETGDYVALARDLDLRTISPDHAIVDRIPRCAP
ncbi:hypothetical protein [Bradyrhizobium sp.]|uniref:hypothetical protein n=1 Tax=Bradyrhizobium sp. TaxID=376 RepID=UPI0040377F88